MKSHFFRSWSPLLCILTFYTSAFTQRTVPESEQMRFKAQVSRDTALLSKLLSNDLMYIHSNALVESKADFLHSVGGGGIQYLAMNKIAEGTLQHWGKTALSQGLVEVQGLYQGNEFMLKLRYTSVYRKEKGVWKLFSWQSTRLP